jgi:serine/threonine protein kinase
MPEGEGLRGDRPNHWIDKKGQGGMSWTVINSHFVFLQEILHNVDSIEDRHDFDIVNKSMVRTIGSITIQGPEGSEKLYVKTYRNKGWGNALRFLFFDSKAKVEWELGIKMGDLGIPSFKPLAYGERRKRLILKEAYLITREIRSSVPLNRFVAELQGEDPDRFFEKKARLIEGLAGLVGDMHRLGVHHRDLHGGNILVQRDGSQGPRHYVIDLHRAEVTGRISKWKRLRSISQLFFSMSAVMVDDDERTFIRLYKRKSQDFKGDTEKALKAIRRFGKRIRFRHFRSRQKRCLKKSTLFNKEKRGVLGWYWWRGAPIKEMESILSRLRSGQESPERVLKSSKETTTSIWRIKSQEGAEKICLKHYHDQGLIYGMKYLFRSSKAMKSWIAAHGLRVLRIPTAKPMALIEERRWRVLGDSFLIMEDLTDFPAIDRYVKSTFPINGPSDRLEEKRAFIAAFAHTMRSLHDRGLFHKDLKAANILIKKTGNLNWKFYLIDLDGVSFEKGPLKASMRIVNLIQINASIPVQISSTDRLRFLLAYSSEQGLSTRLKTLTLKVIAGSKKRAGAWPYAMPHPSKQDLKP